MKRISAYLALFLVTGCIYPFKATLPEQGSPSIVVDANIKLGSFSDITLSYVQPINGTLNTGTYPSGAAYIESESGEKYSSPGSNGEFSIDTRLATTDQRYRVVINADGETIVSDWCTPLPPPTVSDVQIWADDYSVFVSADIDATGGSTGYVALTFFELWAFHSDFIREYDYDPIKKQISLLMSPDLSHYWCWRTFSPREEIFLDLQLSEGAVRDYQVTNFSRTNNRNHKDYTIYVLARNISQSEYRFRSFLKDNVSQGGNLFTPDPGEIAGNLVCETNPDKKVYGYVNAYIYSSGKKSVDGRYYYSTTPGGLLVLEEGRYNAYYWQGYLPISLDAEGNLGWGKAPCYDCVAAGGTLEKPEVSL